PAWSTSVNGVVTSIAVDRTGDLTAVGVASSATEGHTLLLNSAGTAVIDHTNPGRIRSVAISKSGDWVVSGGRYLADAATGKSFGVVYLFHGTATPVFRYVGTDENFSEIADVAITPNGSAFAAVTVGGQALDFTNANGVVAPPSIQGTNAKAASTAAVAMTEDGRYDAFAVGKTLTLDRRDAGGLHPAWNASLAGDVNSVDTDARGEVILAADGGAAEAFSTLSSTPYWAITGAATNATVSSNGSYASFAQGAKYMAVKLPRKLSFLFETSPGVGVPTSPGASTPPHGSVVFHAVLRNDGSLPDAGTIEIPTTRTLAVAVNRTTYALAPGGYEEILVSVAVGEAPPAHYILNLTAHSTEDARYRANLTLGFDVAPASAIVSELIGPTERILAQTQNDSLLVDIANHGNDRAEVTMDIAQHPSNGSLWSVSLIGDRVFTVAGSSHATARVIVTAPRDAYNGTTNLVDVSVRAPSGVTEITVLYRVNPFVGVNFTGPRTIAKFVQPSQFVQYNLTVVNTGSVATDFVATWDAQPSNAKNWVVDLDNTPFTLAPRENHSFAVRVFAPKDAAPGDRDTVKVEVRSVPPPGIALNTARENVTLVANAVAPLPTPPRSTPSPVPGFEPALAFAALAVALLVRRRRA
ncbi:MAG: COG1470 family protein, partial [Thermoplasmatota archaeon]